MSGKNKPGRESKKPKAKSPKAKDAPSTLTHAESLLASFAKREKG